MKFVLCSDADWLLSEEAFQLYASCMYQPSYENFRKQMECLLNDQSVRVCVCEDRGKKTGMMVLKFSDSVAEIIGIYALIQARTAPPCRRRFSFCRAVGICESP